MSIRKSPESLGQAILVGEMLVGRLGSSRCCRRRVVGGGVGELDMYVCMYVCMYVYIYIYTHTCTCVVYIYIYV